MPRTIETVVYEFDELDERAKDKARDWYRQVSAEDFSSFEAESVLYDAAQIGLLFGLDICKRPVKLMNGTTRKDPDVYWAVDCRDAGCTYAGSYGHAKGSVAKVATECLVEYQGTIQKSNAEINRIVRELADVQRRNFYQVQASIDHGSSRSPYSHAMSIDVERADGKAISDDDVETVREALRDVAEWILDSLTAEYEYRQSDECVDEDIRANEYTFTADGEREG